MHTIDTIMLDLIEFLRFDKKIRSEGDFCSRIKMVQPTLTKIKNGKAHFTAEHIRRTCVEFGVNANFIMAIETNVYNDKNSLKIDTYVKSQSHKNKGLSTDSLPAR